MADFNSFLLQAALTLVWAVLTTTFVWFTRNSLVGCAAGANIGLGVVVYYNSVKGVLNLAGLPQLITFGILGFLMGKYAQNRRRTDGKSSTPSLTPRGAQARRLLNASLICCGFIWGSAIAFAVLPAPFLLDFLRSLAGPGLLLEGTTEYAVRIALSAFTFIGFLFYFVATDLEGNFSTIIALGVFMLLNGLVLGAVGLHLLPPHPWEFESGSCLLMGTVIIVCALLYRKESFGKRGVLPAKFH